VVEAVRNRVFRCIENRARGFVGLLLGEVVAGVAVFAIFIVARSPLIGILAGSGMIAALASWRRRDHDRSDYVTIFWRRATARERMWSPLNRTGDGC
jgi:hypothetical protein